ncbi:hypothetical protein JB92DRAFT_2825195 [Gautieria morchelliformis]|nr:hypothetical protein JB92DRAFT_2825195 [Gautieria morchelliformis]
MNPFTLSPVLRTDFRYITPNSTQGQWTGLWPMNARTAPMPQSVQSAYGAEQPSGGSTYAQELSYHGALEPYATYIDLALIPLYMLAPDHYSRPYINPLHASLLFSLSDPLSEVRETGDRFLQWVLCCTINHLGCKYLSQAVDSKGTFLRDHVSTRENENRGSPYLGAFTEYDQWSGLYKLSDLSEDTKFHEGYEAP